ncbi:MAG: hypothetical protein HPY64_08760 [Anaerolineae bacterium]|nr:hypothetical protein [Anaerolineae bacterium]
MPDSHGEPLDLEDLWAGILSRNTALIVQVWRALEREDRMHIWRHLHRMAHEAGWTEPQRVSARYALSALRSNRLAPDED